MKQYLDLLRHVIDEGVDRPDRTGTGTRSVFGHQMRFDLRAGFPLVTTKKVHLRSIIHELLWFLRGETRVESLQNAKVSIWDDWATAEHTAKFGRTAGDLGPVYGHQWRNFGGTPEGATWKSDGVDQIARLLVDLREKPFSRRHIVTGWNPKEADQVALPPCHTLFQFYVTPPNHLSCHLYQRSGDIFLGVPFNIASYALLTMMIAQVTNMIPRDFVHSFGDAHLYQNHFEQARLQLSREPRALPTMRINPEVRDLFAFRFEDFTLENYDPHPAISAPVAV